MNYYKRHIITAALPYANGPLHIGHLAGAYLNADIYSRFMRLMNKDVLFICGSDEHGAAITMRALKENKSPQEIIDIYHNQFVDTFKKIGISFDYYHRTSSELHHETSQDFFRTLLKNGEFTIQETEQYFDESKNQFLADRYIQGTCPKCQNPMAYGDQCEKCGSSLSPTELINPKSMLSGNAPVLKYTKHWFLEMDKHGEWLKKWINEGILDGQEHHDSENWKNHVLGQCNSWIDTGLLPRAMTRDLDWGVDVPQELEGSKGKKLYVWLDAPIGYISATKQWAKENDKDWKSYWCDPESELIHFIGKDNIVFHCLIFPSILKAHGGYNLPVNVPANQFMNLEGQKISTSRNWAVWVHEYLQELPGMEDSLRYYLIKSMPEQKDSEFTWKGFQEAHNTELVNNLSNFVNRVLVLTQKYYDGKVPDFDPDESFEGIGDDEMGGFHDSEILFLFDKIQIMNDCFRKFDFRGALKIMMDISSYGNLLLQKNEPWKQFKKNPEQVAVVLNLALQIVHILGIISRPFLPFTSDKIRNLLSLEPLTETDELLILLDDMAEGVELLPVDQKISGTEYLFSRIEDPIIQTQIDKLHSSLAESNQEKKENAILFEAQKEEISIDEFAKIDIRTAKILEAERIPKADKLLKLKLDLGYEIRTVASGIAEHFSPDEIIGKEVLILANLAPRTIRGVESRGMILMASDPNGKLSFVSPQSGWNSGMIVK